MPALATDRPRASWSSRVDGRLLVKCRRSAPLPSDCNICFWLQGEARRKALSTNAGRSVNNGRREQIMPKQERQAHPHPRALLCGTTADAMLDNGTVHKARNGCIAKRARLLNSTCPPCNRSTTACTRTSSPGCIFATLASQESRRPRTRNTPIGRSEDTVAVEADTPRPAARILYTRRCNSLFADSCGHEAVS